MSNEANVLVAGLARNAAHKTPPANLHGVSVAHCLFYSCHFVVAPLNLAYTTMKVSCVLTIDYLPPHGDNLGYTSLELLLLSLSSCVGTAVACLLRKMNKNITGIEINTKGIRNLGHPTGFHTTIVNIALQSPNTSLTEVGIAIKLAEDSYCPVYAMLNGNVKLAIDYRIIDN